MAGETLVVDGNVNGDVVAAGRRIVVEGKIDGNLVALGESVTVRGDVTGFIATASQTVELEEMNLGGDLWSASAHTNVDEDVKVTGNAVIAGELTSIAGEVQRDFFGFAETIELTGSIERNVEAFASRLNILGDASVGGNLRFRTHSEDRLQLADTASIAGTVEFLDLPEDWERKSKYERPEFYLWRAVILASAFIFGLAVFWLFPAMRDLTIGGGIEGVKTAGLGLIALITLPVASVILLATVVGIPFAFFGFILFLFVWLFAKIIIADQIGQMIFGAMDRDEAGALSLLVGLVVFVVVVSIPAIGGVLSAVLTILGAGLLTQLMLDTVSDMNDRA